MHVYDGSKELATSLSRRRVPLSEEEALAYRVIEYIGENKGRTLPAALISKSLPPAAGAALSPAQQEMTCYVRVTKDGHVSAAFADGAVEGEGDLHGARRLMNVVFAQDDLKYRIRKAAWRGAGWLAPYATRVR